MKTFPARTPREKCSLIAKRRRCAKRTTCIQSLGKSNRTNTCAKQMKLLAVRPSCLMYSKIYLRLEPLGLELVATTAGPGRVELELAVIGTPWRLGKVS